jgi:hypothetical protein
MSELNNNPKYYILDYTHEELENLLERIADADSVSEERVMELINQAQFGGADFSGFARIEYVDKKIADIELLEGPQGIQGEQGPAGKDGIDGKDFTYDMFTQEQLEALVGPQGERGEMGPEGEQGPQGIQGEKGEKGEKGDKGDQGEIGPMGPQGPAGIFDSTTMFEELLTSEKTIVGAINELFQLLKANNPEQPEEPDDSQLANVYYGYFPYTIQPDLMNYADIKLEHLLHEDAVIEEAEGVLGKTSIGLVPEACFIVVAIKEGLNLVAKKDDGIGGLVDFDESTVGANNLKVEFEGEKYLLFGEYTIIDGERFIYVVEK